MINTVHVVVSDALKASMIFPVIFLSSNAKLANILLSIIDDSGIPTAEPLPVFHRPLQASLCELRPDKSLETQSFQRENMLSLFLPKRKKITGNIAGFYHAGLHKKA